MGLLQDAHGIPVREGPDNRFTRRRVFRNFDQHLVAQLQAHPRCDLRPFELTEREVFPN